MKKHIEHVIWQFDAMKYVLLATIVIVPLFVSKAHVFPFTTPKSLLVTMSACVLALLYVWGRSQQKQSTFMVGWMHGVIALFVGVLIVSGALGVNPQYSFFGDLSSGMGVVTVSSIVCIAACIGFLIQKDSSFIKSIGAVSLITSVVFVAILYGGESVLSMSADGSTLGNTSYAGAYLLVNVCFAIGLFASYRRVWQKILVGLVGLWIVSSPVFLNKELLTGSVSLSAAIKNPLLISGSANGAVLGLGIGVAIILFLYLLRSAKKVWQWIGATAIMLLLAGLFFAGQALVQPDSRIHQAYASEKSENRFLFWDIASHGMSQRMLLGWGMNGYTYVFQEHFSPLFFSNQYVPEVWTQNPHNMFKEYAVHTGIVGLIAYITLIGSAAVVLLVGSRSKDTTQKHMSIALFGALAGYVIQNMFVFDTTAALFVWFITIGYAVGISPQTSFVVKNRLVVRIISVLIGVGLVYVFVVAGLYGWKESKKWSDYTQLQKIITDSIPQAIAPIGYAGDSAYLGDKVITFLKTNIDPSIMSGAEKGRYQELLLVLVKEIETDIVRDPYPNFRSHWVAGQIYNLLIETDRSLAKDYTLKARYHFENALDINPYNPLVYYDMAQTFIFENNFDKTKAWIRASIALAPEYRNGYLLADRIIEARKGDVDFNRYVSTVRALHCPKDSVCSNGGWIGTKK